MTAEPRTQADGVPAGAPQIDEPPPASPRDGASAVIWTLWLTYGAFYFCRNNLSVAIPGMTAAANGGLNLSRADVGWILASLKITYGLGQFVNGQLSERCSPRVMLAMGMFGSAALNVLFGLSTGFYFLLFVWAMNGFAQSLGWTPCVRVAANWVPVSSRGHAIGIIGTGYQITQGLTYVVASQAAERFGWRGALYVPAILLVLAGLVMLILLRETPDDDPTRPADAPAAVSRSERFPFVESLYWTMYNPALWLLGTALALLNACRYGFLDWGVAHLMEVREIQVGKAGLNFFVIAIGATAGAYLAGWATDRFFGSRRAPVICILMVLLGVLTLSYDWVVRSSVVGTLLMLVVIGFCIFGPQVLLVGTAPADLAHRGTSAAAAGFVNFMGYMGAAGGDIVTGHFSSEAHGGWNVAIFMWAGWAFAGAVVTGLLWNATARRLDMLPVLVPRVIACAAMTGAAALLLHDGQLMTLAGAAGLAALGLLATGLSRWAAGPALAVSLLGLASVFVNNIVTRADPAWQRTAAVLCFGLTAVAAVMILIERQGDSCESS